MYTLRGPNDNTGIDIKSYIGIKSLMETSTYLKENLMIS